MMTSLYLVSGQLTALSEHVYCVAVAFKMTEQVEQQIYIKFCIKVLAGMALWIEHRPVNQRIARLIPSQGTCLGCGPDPQ